MKRLILNILSLAIAAVQAGVIFFAFVLVTDPRGMSGILSFIIIAVALVINFFLTKLDSHVRGYAYDGKMIFWISFAVGFLRVIILPFVIVGIFISFFFRNKDFANLGYSPLYPVSCLVFAISSIDYMTAGDKVRLHQRIETNELRRKQRAEERRQRAEAERERRKNLPHDTNRHGFCTTQFFPTGYRTITYGGRAGMRITSQRAYLNCGTPTVKVCVYAPIDSDYVKKFSDYYSCREFVVHSAQKWVASEFKNYYSNYTHNYNSCVPISEVCLLVEVST